VDIGADKTARIVQRAIDVAIGSEVDDRVAPGHRRLDRVGIGDVGLDKAVARIIGQIGEIG
jgi:hypothetical protein